MRLFLDELRPPPAGWIQFRSAHRLRELLEMGVVTELSVGDGEGVPELLEWIKEAVFTEDLVPPVIYVRSGAHPRFERMIDVIARRHALRSRIDTLR